MYRFSSRSAESTDLTRRATEAPASVLYSTLRRPIERNTVRTSDFRDAVENLYMIRAKHNTVSVDDCGTAVDNLCITRASYPQVPCQSKVVDSVDQLSETAKIAVIEGQTQPRKLQSIRLVMFFRKRPTEFDDTIGKNILIFPVQDLNGIFRQGFLESQHQLASPIDITGRMVAVVKL